MDDDSGRKPHLLVVKGTFEQFGGAERDLLNNLEAWQNHFEISFASLHLPTEARQRLDSLGILYLTPAHQWTKPVGAWAEFSAKASRTASHRWWVMLELTEQGVRLQDVIADCDAVHITSGVGSLEFSQLLSPEIPVHYHCLEPHRGLHEDVLHRQLNGKPKRSLGLTRLLLGKQRRKDISMTHDLFDRPHSTVNGNSTWIQQRINNVYNIDSGVLWPSVNLAIWDGECPASEEFVVAIGSASFVKGTLETVDMLVGTDLRLHHVGGGSKDDLRELETVAKSKGVDLVIEPRLSQEDLVTLVKRARAVVSLAHGEPFGLTPIEAQAAGTPALMVNEGGYCQTVEDGVSGRLLPRGEWKSWHAALIEAADEGLRANWCAAGRANIDSLGLTPSHQAQCLAEIISNLIN